MAETDLQIEEKKAVQATAESTRDVPVFIPAVDIIRNGACHCGFPIRRWL